MVGRQVSRDYDVTILKNIIERHNRLQVILISLFVLNSYDYWDINRLFSRMPIGGGCSPLKKGMACIFGLEDFIPCVAYYFRRHFCLFILRPCHRYLEDIQHLIFLWEC